jgi:hypothetical protein
MLLAAGALLTLPAAAIELSVDEQEACAQGGGCALITHARFDEVAAEIYQRGLRGCKNYTNERGV